MNLGFVNPNDPHAVRRAFQTLQNDLGFGSNALFAGLTLTGLTASRLIWANASKALASKDLVDLVAGTANRVTVADDAAGGVTLSGPQDIHTAASPTFADLTLSAPSNIYALSHDSFADFDANEHFLQTAITNVSTALSTGLLKVTTGTGALSVVTDNSANWNTAYGWGNHAGLYDAAGTAAGLVVAHELTYVHADIALNTAHRGLTTGNPHSVSASDVGLGSVENTALSTWAGTANIVTVGTIATGTWNATTIGISKGGTGQVTAQAAIDALTQVSGATNEHVLTKDTATGNAIWKAATGGSDAFTVKIDAGATAGYIGAASSDGVLRTGDGLSYADGGDFVTLNTVSANPSTIVRVYRNAAQTMTNNAYTRVNFDTRDFDPGSDFDITTNYRFDPPATGYYFVFFTGSITDLADAKQVTLRISKTGTTHQYTQHWNSSGGAISPYFQMGGLFYLETGTDYLEFYIYHNHGSDRSLTTGINNTAAMICRMTR